MSVTMMARSSSVTSGATPNHFSKPASLVQQHAEALT